MKRHALLIANADAAGGQDRTRSKAGGLLKRKYVHREVLSQGNNAAVIEN